MELWFISAVLGAVFSGTSNFFFKLAAVRGYNSELFSLYGSVTSITLVGGWLVFFPQSIMGYGWLGPVVFMLGVLSAFSGILKIYALRHMDSTLYFPLFKLLSPALAILAGVVLFSETFSFYEWVGMVFGLIVPLMLINRAENGRQNNLVAGLFLVLITGVISAGSGVANKFAIDGSMPVVIVLFYIVVGVAFGSVIAMLVKDGYGKSLQLVKEGVSRGLLFYSVMRAVLVVIGGGFILYALSSGGAFAVVQTIQSMYLLIPVVLAIIIYNEHWNTRKVIAIIMSVGALALLG